jgi:hypothetical protein
MEDFMKRFTILFIILFLFLTGLTYSQVTNKISYQGLLTTSAGTPVIDGSYDLQFDIYNLPVGGSLKYTETQTGIPVSKGTFSAVLRPTSTIFAESLFVEVTALAGPSISTPITFSPRSELTSSPYSLAPWTTNGNNIFYNLGRVGIGTSNPSERLHIKGDPDASICFDHNGDTRWVLNSNNLSNQNLQFIEASYLSGSITRAYFKVGGDFILNTGKLGIGISNPNSKLHVLGDALFSTTGAGLAIYPYSNYASMDFVAIGVTNVPKIQFYESKMTMNEPIGINTTTPQGALDISSTTGGLIVPRMTTTQRNSLSAVNGTIIYNTTTFQFNFRENNVWVTK